MSALVLSQAEVERLLPMGECIELMVGALVAYSSGDAVNPLRQAVWLPDRSGLLGLMPGYLPASRSLGLKVVGVFPGNHGTELDSHQGVVVLFDAETGVTRAILEASAVTGIRTAAVSGVATRLLAREDAGDLAIVGSGVQAHTHLDALAAVRELRRIRVYSPSPGNRAAFAARASERIGLPVESVGSAREAVEGADLVCTTTSAREPVVHGEWLSPGAHVNAVGACVKTARELDTAAVVRSRLFVDSRESARNESGDYLIPLAEGAIGEEHVLGELGEVLLGRVPGRTADDEITLFDSLGIAVEDLAVAHHVLGRALEEGMGTAVDLVGRKP